MKRKNIPVLLLVLALAVTLFIPSAWAVNDGKTELHISTADELRSFARKCTLDTYSVGMKVVLDEDIDLGDEPFYPIPTFSGVFDGGGHTVSGLTLATDGSHQGFFRYIQAEGVVKRLKVEGNVRPEGSKEYIGGVAGTNYGEISNCAFTGSVSGMNYVGGIVGENLGTVRTCAVSGTVEGKRFTGGIAGVSFLLISGCSNSASVNTSITAGGLELEKLSLSGIISTDLTNAEDTDVVSDTGGVAGFSKGIIQNCSNSGTIGYQHYGYNVGGIAGRQSGYMTGCDNSGAVLGRKDVGGIVGQMEPYKTILDTMNLAGEIATLNALVNNAMNGLAANSGAIKETLNSIQQSASTVANNSNINIPSLSPSPSPDSSPAASPSPSTEAPAAESPSPSTEAPATESVEPAPAAASPSGSEIRSAYSGSGGVLLLAAAMPKFELTLLSAVEPSVEPSTAPAEPSPSTAPDAASSALDQMGSDFKTLNTQIDGSVGTLAGDLKAVSGQLARVLTLLANALSGSANLDVIQDVSSEKPDEGTDGKVFGCVNTGKIEADTNVGGIAGDMGIEYEFDLENELMGAVKEAFGSSSIISTVYETKCVLHSCKNYGTVIGKKDNVSCVTGAAELGTIVDCEAYGSAHSTDGSYVGGIVGVSNVKISSCSAMCQLDGLEYVGGIAGMGSSITDCRTLIGVGSATACCGAIAGWGDMTQEGISGNSFVSETLGAVDGISYSGYAEPMPYEQFMGLELPEDFTALKLSFVANGNVVKELSFTYGGSVDESEIPAVPVKSGFTGEWPEYDYSKLYFSDTIEAVYTSRQATLAVENTREDSPMSLALAEGDFKEGTELKLNEFKDAGPEGVGEVLEKWVLRVYGGDSGDGYSVRFLAPSPSLPSRSVDIYVLDGGVWTKADVRSYGSYLAFPAQGDTVVFCAVETESALNLWLMIGAVLLGAAAVFLAVFFVKRSKKKKSAEPDAAAGNEPDGESAGNAPDAGNMPDGDKPQTDVQPENKDQV